LFPTAFRSRYAVAKSLLRSQTNIWTVAEIQCRFSFVCSNRIARFEKCDMGLCIQGASRVPHKGKI
jgi:hypothetical protein